MGKMSPRIHELLIKLKLVCSLESDEYREGDLGSQTIL
jgi:hypothetical protein